MKDRTEWERRNRAAAAEQAKAERRPEPLRVGRAAMERRALGDSGYAVAQKAGEGPPENKDAGGPPENKAEQDDSAYAALFASGNAEELARRHALSREQLAELVAGSGTGGRYTVADVKAAIAMDDD